MAKTNRRLEASGGDPFINVHMLGESVFCPRAGLISYETQAEEDADDTTADPPQLNFIERMRFIPRWYSLRRIERQLSKVMSVVFGFSLPSICFIVLVGGYFIWKFSQGRPTGVELFTAVLLLSAAGAFLIVPLKLLPMMFKLIGLRMRIMRAPRIDPGFSQLVRTPWMSLIRGGFDPRPPQKSFRDERAKLAGKPWRVLQKGNLRLPVMRIRTDSTYLYPQHFVRIAAYCHLLECCEGADSPAGIVLFRDQENVAIVPNSAKTRGQLEQAITDLRNVIRQSRDLDEDPPEPTDPGICKGCHLARIIHGEDITRFGKVLPIFPAVRDVIEEYDGSVRQHDNEHSSHCATRFRWRPPGSKYPVARLDDTD